METNHPTDVGTPRSPQPNTRLDKPGNESDTDRAVHLPLILANSFIAAALGVGAALLARAVLGILTPAEIFGDRITVLIPLPVFSQLLGFFGTSAKHWFFVSLLVGEAVLTALAGVLYLALRAIVIERVRRSTQRVSVAVPEYVEALALIAFLWVLSAGVLAPLLGGGPFGARLTGGVGGALIAQLAPDIIFAVCFIALLRRDSAMPAPSSGASSERLSRRRVLSRAGIGIGILAGSVVAWEVVSSGLASLLGISGPRRAPLAMGSTDGQIIPPPQPTYGPWTDVAGQTSEVTRTDRFYYVSKNFGGDPQVAGEAWRLQITGMVNTPYALTYRELLALPTVERYHTLECISNDVGGDLMSTAYFTGVSVANVLNHAGIQPGASEMIFRAADGYSDRLHLSQALDPRALIVHHINGEPLPIAHGFPARLLIPGLYGMKNGKWLTSLELGSGDYTGYWEQQGWSAEAFVKPTARVDVPHDGDVLAARSTYIAGIAYTADKGVAEVQVTTDGGRTWLPANLRRPLGALTWVLWEYPWTPSTGNYTIAARVVDLDGDVQTSAIAPTLPDGASGYDAIRVAVG
jgi:DMSO/TMAO reductase YedYZ molybdopterin-dependent catalytic subunit